MITSVLQRIPVAVWFLIFYLAGTFLLSFNTTKPKAADERAKVAASEIPKVEERPGLRVTAEQLAGLPVRSQIAPDQRYGRFEVHEHGAIYDRGMNFSLVAVMPPKDAFMTYDRMPHLSDVKLMRRAPIVSSSVHYDLETRFGRVRATEVRVDADGQWKQCLTYLSRFDTTAIQLMGSYCDNSGTKPSPYALACMLNRIELVTPLASPEADAYLRERMTRANSCSAQPVSQTIDTGYRRQPSPPSRWSTPSAQQRY